VRNRPEHVRSQLHDATRLTAPSGGAVDVGATRGTDIPSEVLRVCVAEQLGDCPARRGERIVGSPNGDRIKGTAGSDSIRARGGADAIDLRKGGADTLDCGPGRDTVLVARADRDDHIARDCERVRRR
jgi:Ca2+-binding RTX toxin-like protein